MTNINKMDEVGYLDVNYQEEFIAELLIDNKFCDNVITMVRADNFINEELRSIVSILKSFYDAYMRMPNIKELNAEINRVVNNQTKRDLQISVVEGFKNYKGGNKNVQEKSQQFFAQQDMLRALAKVNKIIATGDVTRHKECVDIMTKVVMDQTKNDTGSFLFEGLDKVYEPDYRKPIPLGLPGLDHILNGGLAKGELAIMIAPLGTGKAQPISEPILTPKGWVKMGDIKVNDEVIGSDGNKQTVVGVYPQGIRNIYKIIFSDKTEAYCDAEHLWSVNTYNMRHRKTRINNKNVFQPNNSYITLKTSDMLDKVMCKNGSKNYRLPTIKPVEFNSVDVKIDPYLLGVLIGDGCFTKNFQCPTITSGDDEVCERLSKNIDFSLLSQYKPTCKVIRFKTSLRDKLISYGLMDKTSDLKFIPEEYKYNSKEVRINLLQGLMDSDGFVEKRSARCYYYTTSERLKDDVRELVLSLGGTVRVTEKIPTYEYKGVLKQGKLVYNVSISFNNDIIPFKLTRKIERYKPRTKYINQKFISSIEFSHEEEAQCIKVSNEDQLYVTRDYVLTHNTTMSTYVASQVMRNGYKVVQMFFEDTEQQIRQKHAACLHNIEIHDLHNHKDECIPVDRELAKQFGENLILKPFPVGRTHVSTLRNYLNKLQALGHKPDFIVLDYIDKVTPEKNEKFASKFEGQDEIVNQVEGLCKEFDVACLTMIQSNRSGIGNENVRSTNSGGSIGRAQIGHVILSLSKTEEQATINRGTIFVEKNRVGTAPWKFEDIVYNNGTVQIEIPLELGKKQINALDHKMREEHGISQVDFLKEAKLKIAQKNNYSADAIKEPEKLVEDQTLSDVEKSIDSQKLEETFNNEKQN